MGCVRKRGKSWNAQVRISGWRSFTKTFKTKLDATEWVVNLEEELKSKPLPEKNIKNLKLVALISGHKDVRQLFRYTHLKPESLIAKYSKIF